MHDDSLSILTSIQKSQGFSKLVYIYPILPTVIHTYSTKGPEIEQIPTAQFDYEVVKGLVRNVLSYREVIAISGNSVIFGFRYQAKIFGTNIHTI